MKLQFRKRSLSELVSCNETQVSETQLLKPVSRIIPRTKLSGEQSREAEVVRSQLQKRSALEWIDRTILLKQGYNTPQRA